MKRISPPKSAERILAILSSSRKIGILGDTEEEYRMILSEKGRLKADVLYVWQIFKPVPFFIRSTLYWSITILKNYLKIVLRNMRNNKIYSFINIAGLAVGMACFLAIFLYVRKLITVIDFREREMMALQDGSICLQKSEKPGWELRYQEGLGITMAKLTSAMAVSSKENFNFFASGQK